MRGGAVRARSGELSPDLYTGDPGSPRKIAGKDRLQPADCSSPPARERQSIGAGGGERIDRLEGRRLLAAQHRRQVRRRVEEGRLPMD